MIGQVQVNPGTFDIVSVVGDWVNRSTVDNFRRPILQYLIQGLGSSTYYQLEVLASNEMGKSQSAKEPFVFLTTEGMYAKCCNYKVTTNRQEHSETACVRQGEYGLDTHTDSGSGLQIRITSKI